MNKEAIEHRNRLKILENTMGTTFYETGHLHLAISDAMEKYHKAKLKLLDIPDVVSSAWFCKISNINRQRTEVCTWFEIVTGKNETEVAIKITEKFGKGAVYNLLDKYELM